MLTNNDLIMNALAMSFMLSTWQESRRQLNNLTNVVKMSTFWNFMTIFGTTVRNTLKSDCTNIPGIGSLIREITALIWKTQTGVSCVYKDIWQYPQLLLYKIIPKWDLNKRHAHWLFQACMWVTFVSQSMSKCWTLKFVITKC